MATYPRCPHCNTILPEFNKWEKKICPNCNKRVRTKTSPKEIQEATLQAKLRKAILPSWLYLCGISLLGLFDSIATASALFGLGGIIVTILQTFKRHKITKAYFNDQLKRLDPQEREVIVRKQQLFYYIKAFFVYLISFTVVFLSTAIISQKLRQDILSEYAFSFIIPLSFQIACCWCSVILRLVTLRPRNTKEDQCTHTTPPSPTPAPKKKQQKKNGSRLAYIIFCAIFLLGLLILSVGIYENSLPKKYPERFVKIPATIVDIRTTTDSDGDTDHTVYVTYSYEDKEYKHKELSYYKSSMDEGDIIKITIDKENPSEIHTDSTAMIVVGAIFTWFGILTLVFILFQRNKSKKR